MPSRERRASPACDASFRSRRGRRPSVSFCGSWREIFHTGSKPKRMPTARETRSVKHSTGALRCTSEERGNVAGTSFSAACVPQLAKSKPNAPPARASIVLSVSSWLMILMRPAPRAKRIANSRARAFERARSRFATLAHAISSKKPTAPNNPATVAVRNLPLIGAEAPVLPGGHGPLPEMTAQDGRKQYSYPPRLVRA